MRYKSTNIKFDGETPSEVMNKHTSEADNYEGSVWFSTTENDMYQEELSGSRRVIMNKIPGRDRPYFYKVDHEVLEFNMLLAFEETVSEENLKLVVDWLYQDEYKKLEFGNDNAGDSFQNRYFNVIFTNKPTVKYVYVGDRIQGFIKLHAQCNSSTGFEEEIINIEGGAATPDNTGSATLDNTGGAMPLIYKIELAGTDTNIIIDDIDFGKEESGKKLTIQNDTKTIKSTSDRNVYSQWNPREFIEVKPGEVKEINISGVEKEETINIEEDSIVSLDSTRVTLTLDNTTFTLTLNNGGATPLMYKIELVGTGITELETNNIIIDGINFGEKPDGEKLIVQNNTETIKPGEVKEINISGIDLTNSDNTITLYSNIITVHRPVYL